MHIIIIANHQPEALAPLVDNDCIAMLPVGGKPVVEHLLENACAVPHSRLTVIGSRGVRRLREFVGSGERWGVSLAYETSRPNEPVSSLERRLPELFDGHVLVVAADRVYTDAFSHQHLATCSDQAARTVQVMEPALSLDSHARYLEANLAAVRGDIDVLRLRGRERGLGLTTGYRTRIDARSVQYGVTHTGNHCRVEPSVQLKGTNVLASSVVVDRDTSLEDCVVLENTYIGEHLKMKRCIVSGRHIIRVDEGIVVKLSDSFMIAPLDQGVFASHVSGRLNQIAGAVAGVCALPLCGLAMVVALWQNPYQPVIRKQWVSNKLASTGDAFLSFETFEFNVSTSVLARLPQLFDVARGHMRWFGVSLATESELAARRDSRQMERDNHRCGVFGFAQLRLPDSATSRQRFLEDDAYVRSASTGTNIQLLRDAVSKLISGEAGSAGVAQGS